MVRMHFATTNLGLEGGFAEIAEFGKVLRQVGIALQLDLALIGTTARGSALAISGVELIHNIHSFNDFSNGTKALIIQKGIALFTGIDKNLRCATIGTGRGKHHRSPRIGHLDGIVLEVLSAPLGLQGGISRNAKLRNKARNDTKDAATVPKSRFRQLL